MKLCCQPCYPPMCWFQKRLEAAKFFLVIFLKKSTKRQMQAKKRGGGSGSYISAVSTMLLQPMQNWCAEEKALRKVQWRAIPSRRSIAQTLPFACVTVTRQKWSIHLCPLGSTHCDTCLSNQASWTTIMCSVRAEDCAEMWVGSKCSMYLIAAVNQLKHIACVLKQPH